MPAMPGITSSISCASKRCGSAVASACEQLHRVLSRDQLLEMPRLHGAGAYDLSIDVQILRVRRKIEICAYPPAMIRAGRGAG